MRYDFNADDILPYTDKFKFTGTAFITSIGSRYFFKETGKLKAYGLLMLSKTFLTGKLEDANDSAGVADTKQFIKNTKVWGGQLGFGVEYFFDDNFSLGGEFGLMLLHARNKQENTGTVSNPNGPDPLATTTIDTKINIRPTYTRFSLNFYF